MLNKQRMTNIKSTLFKLILLVLLVILAFSVWHRFRPLTVAPFEQSEVKRVFYSLMSIAEQEYGINPINNLRDPQPRKEFVRSFDSPLVFKQTLEQAFSENGYSYSKTLDAIAADGLNIIMDSSGGAGMVVLLTMPVKGLKRREIDTVFSGRELKNFKASLDLIDQYLCCPLLDDF